MFKAILMVCSLAQANDCMQFTDMRGPYQTKEQCMARIHEMLNDINPTLPDVARKHLYKCDDEIGIEL